MENTEFVPVSGLEGEINQINPNAFYAVDFSKMNSVQDLVLVLAAMGLTFHASHPHFDSVKRLLALDNPIIPPGFETKPTEVPPVLPKLKKVK